MQPNTMTLPDIAHSVFINVPPSRIYETISTASGWNAWFTTNCILENKPNGKLEFFWKDWGPGLFSVTVSGEVVESIQNRKFVFLWQSEGSMTGISAMGTDGKRGMTKVTFDLEPRGEGTVVTVIDSGFTDIISFRECSLGWGEALMLLKFYLEHGLTYGTVPAK
jgi:uncharacterized protein YndB with AHSA1/START domain